MALIFADRIKETVTTTSTSDFVLTGATVTGYTSFGSALADGDTTHYCCVDNTTGAWEVGLGTYTAGTTTLARTTVYSSSNSGAKVSFASGNKDLFITFTATDIGYILTTISLVTVQALGTKSADFTVDVASGGYASVTMGAACNISLTSPAATYVRRLTLAVTQGATPYTLTLKAADANVISSGGLMSSGDALPNSGANTIDVFTFEWNGTKWETIDARYDVKA